MKKLLCTLLALALACIAPLCLAEPAEDVIDAFTDTWVNGDYAAEIWYEDGAFHCRGTRFITVDDGYSWEFGSVTYDAGAGCLVCADGVMLHETRNAGTDALDAEETASGFGATLTVADGNALQWAGSGDAIPDMTFARLSDAEAAEYLEAAQAFVGLWGCGRATLTIEPDAEDPYRFAAEITWGSSAAEASRWTYDLTYDDLEKAMTGTGSRADEVWGEDGELAESNTVYTDGAVAFTIDDAGLLHWADAEQNAGADMDFVHSSIEHAGE